MENLTQKLTPKEIYDNYINHPTTEDTFKLFYTRKLDDGVELKAQQFESKDEDYCISLMWNQRSVDTFLGLPFNIASYGLLLEIIAKEVNMVPDELVGNLGDVHLYSNHIEQAKEQMYREPMKLPTVHVRDGIFCSSINDVILENYQSHPAIKAPLSN